MHPEGMPSAMDLVDFEKSADLKHPNVYSMRNVFLFLFLFRPLNCQEP